MTRLLDTPLPHLAKCQATTKPDLCFIAANRYRLALSEDQPYCNSIPINADERFALL